MNAGTQIVRSSELLDQTWMQAEDMAGALSAMTETALENGDLSTLRSAGAAKLSYETSASGWSTTSYGISFPVMGRKRRKSVPAAWLNYQISVFGGGIPPDSEGQPSIGPVLHVSFWHDPTDFEYPGLYVEFPPAWDDCGIDDGRLLVWEGGDADEFRQWTFSIRLLEMNNEDTLRTSILGPIKALLAGTDPALALPSSLPGLVMYTSEDQTVPGWNLIARPSGMV